MALTGEYDYQLTNQSTHTHTTPTKKTVCVNIFFDCTITDKRNQVIAKMLSLAARQPAMSLAILYWSTLFMMACKVLAELTLWNFCLILAYAAQ